MRAVAFVLAVAAMAAPALARAEGAGQIACENQVRQLGHRLRAESGQLSAGQVQVLNRRLQIANEQCPQGLTYALPQLSQISRDLDAGTAPQTAQLPAQGPLEQDGQGYR